MLFVDLTVLSRAELLLCCKLFPVTPDIYACCIRGYYGYYYYNHDFRLFFLLVCPYKLSCHVTDLMQVCRPDSAIRHIIH